MIAATAPAAAEASSAASAAPACNASTSGAPAGFDAILVLQSLAATCESLDAGDFEAADTLDGLATDDEDDDSREEVEGSLAFLSALINATTPRDSASGFESGAGEQGAPQDEAAPLPIAIKADPGLVADSTFSTEKAEALLGLAPVNPEILDSRAAADASQNLARAAEMLAQAQRPAAEVEKPSVLTHARDPRWADDFSARVSLMVRAGESAASLQLTPVDLGPVEINVTVKDSQASIHFGASQAETRALIEASLPRLRELLASQGFSLLDASVSSGFSQSQQSAFASGNRAGVDADAAVTEVRAVKQLGLLDLYA